MTKMKKNSPLGKEMQALKKEGKSFQHLATCPASYVLYKNILFKN